MKGIESSTAAGFALWLSVSLPQPGFSQNALHPNIALGCLPSAIAQVAIAQASSFNGTPRYTDTNQPMAAGGAGDVYSAPGTFAPSGVAATDAGTSLPSPYATPSTEAGQAYGAPPLSPAPGSITPFSTGQAYSVPAASGSPYSGRYVNPQTGIGGLRGPAGAGYPDNTGQYVNPPVADRTGLPPHTTKSGGGGGAVGATVGLGDRATKSSVGLADRAGKSSVGLADRAAKTSLGVPKKLIKSLF